MEKNANNNNKRKMFDETIKILAAINIQTKKKPVEIKREAEGFFTT